MYLSSHQPAMYLTSGDGAPWSNLSTYKPQVPLPALQEGRKRLATGTCSKQSYVLAAACIAGTPEPSRARDPAARPSVSVEQVLEVLQHLAAVMTMPAGKSAHPLVSQTWSPHQDDGRRKHREEPHPPWPWPCLRNQHNNQHTPTPGQAKGQPEHITRARQQGERRTAPRRETQAQARTAPAVPVTVPAQAAQQSAHTKVHTGPAIYNNTVTSQRHCT